MPLLVADEKSNAAPGRTGRYFAYEWSGIRPDIVVLAKPLAAGLPLGATLFSESAAEALPPGAHGTTFGGGPLAVPRRSRVSFRAWKSAMPQNGRGSDGSCVAALTRGFARNAHPVIREVQGEKVSSPGPSTTVLSGPARFRGSSSSASTDCYSTATHETGAALPLHAFYPYQRARRRKLCDFEVTAMKVRRTPWIAARAGRLVRQKADRRVGCGPGVTPPPSVLLKAPAIKSGQIQKLPTQPIFDSVNPL